MRRLAWCAVLAVLGCGSEPPLGTQQGESREIPVIEVALGDSYDLSIDRLTGGEPDGRHVKLLRFEVAAGQSFAVVMRRTDGDLDAFLRLSAGPDQTVAESDYDQHLLPMAARQDAVVVHAASQPSTFVVMAADLDLDGEASFQLDLLALEAALPSVDLNRFDTAARIVTDTLREREPELVDYITRGAIAEGEQGMLEGYPSNAELSERAAVQGLVAAVNSGREVLFAELQRGADGDSSGDADARVPVFCGSLWRMLRSEAHLLRLSR